MLPDIILKIHMVSRNGADPISIAPISSLLYQPYATGAMVVTSNAAIEKIPHTPVPDPTLRIIIMNNGISQRTAIEQEIMIT